MRTTYDEVRQRKQNAVVESAEPARQRHGEHLVVGAVDQTTPATHVHLSTRRSQPTTHQLKRGGRKVYEKKSPSFPGFSGSHELTFP